MVGSVIMYDRDCLQHPDFHSWLLKAFTLSLGHLVLMENPPLVAHWLSLASLLLRLSSRNRRQNHGSLARFSDTLYRKSQLALSGLGFLSKYLRTPWSAQLSIKEPAEAKVKEGNDWPCSGELAYGQIQLDTFSLQQHKEMFSQLQLRWLPAAFAFQWILLKGFSVDSLQL